MRRVVSSGRFVWPVVFLVVGLVLGNLWPQTPLHTTATDRTDTYAIATGFLDQDVEAVYWLDFLTGDLTAAVLGRRPGTFGAVYRYNVLRDLQVDPTKNPKFLLVTGLADVPRSGGRIQPARSAVYVAEITTGKMAAYLVPWNRSAFNAGQPIAGTLQPMGVIPLRAGPAGGTPAAPTLPGAPGIPGAGLPRP